MRGRATKHEGLQVDPGSTEPLYRQLARILTQQIMKGGLAQGAALSERNLAEQYAVTRDTVRGAFHVLSAHGLVRRLPRKGTVVADVSRAGQRFGVAPAILVRESRPRSVPSTWFDGIYQGIQTAAQDIGYDLQRERLREPLDVPLSQYEAPDPSKIGGVILYGVYDQRYMEMFRSERVPLVLADYWANDLVTDTFQLCRDLLNGKNRRTTRRTHTFANGLILCKHCGSMITGERIRRKLNDGSVRVHTYYRCANNHPDDDHPTIRWRESDLENAVIAQLESMRMPTAETGEWFRDTLDKAFSRLRGDQGQQKRILGRKKAELERQSERLLSVYLEGHLDAGTYQDRAASLQGQIREIETSLSACGAIDPSCRDLAIRAFDFTQKAVELWRGSKIGGKQRILRAVSLNRTLSDVSLCLEKRKPFSLLTERLPVLSSRGDSPGIETLCQQFIAAAADTGS